MYSLLILALVGQVLAKDLPTVQLPWGTYQASHYDPDGDVSFTNLIGIKRLTKLSYISSRILDMVKHRLATSGSIFRASQTLFLILVSFRIPLQVLHAIKLQQPRKPVVTISVVCPPN